MIEGLQSINQFNFAMTECNRQQLFEFQGHFGRKVTADFGGGYLSSDGGAVLLRGMDLKLGLIGRLAGCFRDVRFQPLVEHSVEELLRLSADFISTVTDSVHEEVVECQNRPLERMYPVVFFDALRVKIRDEGSVRNKEVYPALAVASDGNREVLGIWIEQNEGAKFWLRVMNELRHRGMEDILIAAVGWLERVPGRDYRGV